MLNINLISVIGAIAVTSSVIMNYFNNAKPVWENIIKQQEIVNSESKRYGEKLRSLEETVMKQWEYAFESVGNSDRVSLAKRLNIQGTSLIPRYDVPGITANESIVSSIGGNQVSLGLRKVCFGQGKAGYQADGRSINSVLAAMRELESKPGIDFDQFTISSSNSGLNVNFYDLCVYLKDEV